MFRARLEKTRFRAAADCDRTSGVQESLRHRVAYPGRAACNHHCIARKLHGLDCLSLFLLGIADRLSEEYSLFRPQSELLREAGLVAVVKPCRQSLRGGEQ